MKSSRNSLVLTAAFAGLAAGVAARAATPLPADSDTSVTSGAPIWSQYFICGQKGNREHACKRPELLQRKWGRNEEGMGKEFLQG